MAKDRLSSSPNFKQEAASSNGSGLENFWTRLSSNHHIRKFGCFHFFDKHYYFLKISSYPNFSWKKDFGSRLMFASSVVYPWDVVYDISMHNFPESRILAKLLTKWFLLLPTKQWPCLLYSLEGCKAAAAASGGSASFRDIGKPEPAVLWFLFSCLHQE